MPVAPPLAPPSLARPRWLRLTDCALIAAWLTGLALVVVSPYLLGSSTVGEDRVRNTIRLALGWYVLGLSLLLLPARADRSGRWRRGRLARWCWTFAWATYLVHVALAFHYYHHWSHADAVEHTRRVSGVGEGIYASHLFTLVWTADVAAWWLWPAGYARRRRWVDVTLHGFMLFIVFNATVVYGHGPIRWVGVASFAGLSGLALLRWNRPGGRRLAPSHPAAGLPPGHVGPTSLAVDSQTLKLSLELCRPDDELIP